MSKEQMYAVKAFLWLVTSAVCWAYSARFSSLRYETWFWGISFWVDVFVFAGIVTNFVLNK